jgi:hypothetical protein
MNFGLFDNKFVLYRLCAAEVILWLMSCFNNGMSSAELAGNHDGEVYSDLLEGMDAEPDEIASRGIKGMIKNR